MIMTMAVLLFGIFALFAYLMITNQLPSLVALPLMAVTLMFAAGIVYYYSGFEAAPSSHPYQGDFFMAFKQTIKDILTTVVTDGSTRLFMPFFIVIFGSILSYVVSSRGIAEQVIKTAAELGGDKPRVLSVILTLGVSFLFTVLGGLGSVIMVASLVFPVLLSVDVSPIACACLFLLALSLGGTFNFANWQLYKEVLGLSQEQILSFAVPFGLIFLVMTAVFLFREVRKKPVLLHFYADTKRRESIPPLAYLTPVIPLVLILVFSLRKMLLKNTTAFDFPMLAALAAGIVYGIITTRRRNEKLSQLFLKSCYEGVQPAVPALFLIMGIGMLLNSVASPQVTTFIKPALQKLLPQTMFAYIIFFTLLAPLALYRGPFNLWGMGSGFAAIMAAAGVLPKEAVMAALMSVGMIQGVCDPTNTHNVWIANNLNVSVQDILKKTLPYMWLLAFFGLLLAGMRYF